MRINLLGKEIIFEIKEDIHRSSKLKKSYIVVNCYISFYTIPKHLCFLDSKLLLLYFRKSTIYKSQYFFLNGTACTAFTVVFNNWQIYRYCVIK